MTDINTEKLSVLLLGAGSMGGSMLKGWIEEDLLDPARSGVISPSGRPNVVEMCQTRGVPVNPENDQAWDICVLAVKPQMFPSVLPDLDWPDIDKTLFLSVAAGVSIETIRNHLKGAGAGNAPIVRVMPNLPTAVRKGCTLLYAGDDVSEEQRAAADRLISATGSAVWMNSEDELDRAMAISGCAPAYAFLLVEAMTDAGVAVGLDRELSERISRETVIGAGYLMEADPRSAPELSKAVQSPGGTTAQAVGVLDREDGMRPLMEEAVKAAIKRAKELAS